MDVAMRQECIASSKIRARAERPACPFKPTLNGRSQPCTKQSGICSLKLYSRDGLDSVTPASGNKGALRCLCPHRFREDGIVQAWVGKELLGIDNSVSVSEVPFLKPDVLGDWIIVEELNEEEEVDEEGANVGRIDNVLVHPDLRYLRWCAVEMQAVYFSGQAMSEDYATFSVAGTSGIPFPSKVRRPDYRSSGPKRLMPQLQIKVPTLRRWGKKMAVVVDEAFFAALGRMDTVSDVSNSDIAWFVVGFEEHSDKAKLVTRAVRFTTLERAVEGLTAGLPMTLSQFEDGIRSKLP